MESKLKISINSYESADKLTAFGSSLCGIYSPLFMWIIADITGFSAYYSIVAFVVVFSVNALYRRKIFRFHKLICLLPVLLSLSADLILKDRFTSEMTVAFNNVEAKICLRNCEIFLPISGESGFPILLPMTILSLLAMLFTIFPRRGVCAVLTFLVVLQSSFFGEISVAEILFCVMTAIDLVSDIGYIKYRKYAVSAVCTVALIMVGYAFGIHDFVGGMSAVKNAKEAVNSAVHGETEIEVVMEDPSPLYLRESVESPQINAKQLSEFSQELYQIYSQGYYPTKSISEPANALKSDVFENSGKVTVNVKSGKSDIALVPYGVVDSENAAVDLTSLSGDKYIVESGNVYSYEISEGYLSGYADMLDELKNNAENTQIRCYLMLEQVYRIFVYETYTQLSESEKNVISAHFEGSAEEKINEKISAIKAYIGENITLSDIEKKFSLSDVMEISRCTDERGYATLTVFLARYCGLAARVADGYYIPRAKTDDMPQNGAVTLSSADNHVWAEFYLDGVGWVPLETYPDYVDDISPVGFTADTAEDESGSEVDSGVFSDEDNENIPPQAAEIVSEDRSVSVGRVLVYCSVLIALILLLWAVAMRISALVRRRRIFSKSPEKSVFYTRRYGLMLIGLSGVDTQITPEELLEKLREFPGGISEDFENCENAFEKMLYSGRSVSEEDALKCQQFYLSAREFYKRSSRPFKRIARRIFAGIY